MPITLDDVMAEIQEVGRRVAGIEDEIGHADTLARLRESAAQQEKLEQWLTGYHRKHRSILGEK